MKPQITPQRILVLYDSFDGLQRSCGTARVKIVVASVMQPIAVWL